MTSYIKTTTYLFKGLLNPNQILSSDEVARPSLLIIAILVSIIPFTFILGFMPSAIIFELFEDTGFMIIFNLYIYASVVILFLIGFLAFHFFLKVVSKESVTKHRSLHQFGIPALQCSWILNVVTGLLLGITILLGSASGAMGSPIENIPLALMYIAIPFTMVSFIILISIIFYTQIKHYANYNAGRMTVLFSIVLVVISVASIFIPVVPLRFL